MKLSLDVTRTFNLLQMTSNEEGTPTELNMVTGTTKKRSEAQPGKGEEKGEEKKIRRGKRSKTEEDGEDGAKAKETTAETAKKSPAEKAKKATAMDDDTFKLEFREVMKTNPLRFKETSAAQSVADWDAFIIRLGETPCYDFHKHAKRDCTCLQKITQKQRAAIVSTLAPLTMFPRESRPEACALLVKEWRNKMHRSEFLFPMPDSDEMVRVCVFRFRSLVDLTGQTAWKKAREDPKSAGDHV